MSITIEPFEYHEQTLDEISKRSLEKYSLKFSSDPTKDSQEIQDRLYKYFNQRQPLSSVIYEGVPDPGRNWCTVRITPATEFFKEFQNLSGDFVVSLENVRQIHTDMMKEFKFEFKSELRTKCFKAAKIISMKYHYDFEVINSIYLDYIVHMALLADKKADAEEFKDNPWLNLVCDVLDAGQTIQLGAISSFLKGAYAGIKLIKGNFKLHQVEGRLKSNILEIERFFNILGCMTMFYRIFADQPEGYFDHAMESNYMCVVMDKRELETDQKKKSKKVFKNDSGFLLYFDKVKNDHASSLFDCIQTCPEKWIAFKELFDSNFMETMKFDFKCSWINYENIAKEFPNAMKKAPLIRAELNRQIEMNDSQYVPPIGTPINITERMSFAQPCYGVPNPQSCVPCALPQNDPKGMLRGLGFNDAEIQGFISLFGALPELSVLYDSAMDEQTGAACHARIDGKGRTITIAKTKNRFAGGIASSSWRSGNNEMIYDRNAVIFFISGSQTEFFRIANSLESQALIASNSFGPAFGNNFYVAFSPLRCGSYPNRSRYRIPERLCTQCGWDRHVDTDNTVYYEGEPERVVIFGF